MRDAASRFEPLPARLRPAEISQFFGQSHLLGEGAPLYQAIQMKRLYSMLFWGPSGTGKTTLAYLLAKQCDLPFQVLSAMSSGVKEIREAGERGIVSQQEKQKQLLLFVDEIHRFNKAQQDALLPYVENGTFILIASTTENPSFVVNNALLSRLRVHVLKALTKSELESILNSAWHDEIRGLGLSKVIFPDELLSIFIEAADGDARKLLMNAEALSDFRDRESNALIVTESILTSVLGSSLRKFDRGGEYFYDCISALHKSIRGSSPDAALYWFMRMLDGGADPMYVVRRLIRTASEDIGNADPRALTTVLDACQAYERLGSPEGELAIAQAVLYLAVAPKSNAVYTAFQEVKQDVAQSSSKDIPLHLRNAPTKLMKSMGYGKHYRYAHDEEHAYVPNEQYFPNDVKPKQYYHPVSRGLEIKIKERLAFLRSLDESVKSK